MNFNYGEKLWRVGTRDTVLAMRKTEAALALCQKADAKFQYRLITTGELHEEKEWSFEVRVSHGSLSREARLRSDLKMLEEALEEKVIDFFVDDLGQLPLRLSDKLRLAAVLPRRDVRDVLIVRKGQSFSGLPAGANVGAYGERRAFLLAQLRGDLLCHATEDSLPQGMERVIEDDYSGFIVSAADLQFTDLEPYRSALSFIPFSAKAFCPAPGQGLTGFFTAAGDREQAATLRDLIDEPKARAAYESETRIARKLLGVQVDVRRQAAAYVYYDETHTACLRAVNTLSARGAPRQVDMALAYRGHTRPEPDLEKAAMGALLGKISLVGAGPGQQDLLTLRALELLRTADVVAYDDPTVGSVLSRASAQAEKIYLNKSMTAPRTILPPGEKVCRLLMEKARQGKNAVRLFLGDPWLLEYGGAEARQLARAKMPFEVVPGVSAALSAAAFAAVPATLTGTTNAVHLMDGREPFAHVPAGGKDFRALLQTGGTMVFTTVVAHLPELCGGLLAAGMAAAQPCLLISDAGLATQRVLAARLDEMARKAVLANMTPPATFVVGPTVRLASELSWWPPSGFLSGKMVVVGKSRANDAYAAALKEGARARGARALELSLVEQHTSEATAARLDKAFLALMARQNKRRKTQRGALWLVFSSGVAVDAWHRCLVRTGFDIRALAQIKIAAFGAETLRALAELGFQADYVPQVPDMDHLAIGLGKQAGSEDLVVQLRGAMSSPVLSVAMQLRRIPFADLVAYETLNTLPGGAALRELLADIDYFIFTSPAAVNAFLDSLAAVGMTPQTLEKAKIHLIPATASCASTLKARGYARGIGPESYDEAAVFRCLTDLCGEERAKNGESGA